jgi:hypothetical protein
MVSAVKSHGEEIRVHSRFFFCLAPSRAVFGSASGRTPRIAIVIVTTAGPGRGFVGRVRAPGLAVLVATRAPSLARLDHAPSNRPL